MRFEQEKMIVGSLPSLYPLQKFEEEAINALVSLPIDDDTISRAKAIEALTEYGNGQTLYISVEEATRRIKQLSPAHGTNLAEVGTDCISREQAIEALDKRFDSIPMEQTSEILMLRKDLRELPPAQPPMPSNTSNALEALDSVNATQSNTLEASDCDPSQIAAQIIHDAIDNTTFAEEPYPGIKEQLHRSVEEWEKLQPVFTEIAEEYKKACKISYINKPLAYALHEVWKKHDRRDTKRNE